MNEWCDGIRRLSVEVASQLSSFCVVYRLLCSCKSFAINLREWECKCVRMYVYVCMYVCMYVCSSLLSFSLLFELYIVSDAMLLRSMASSFCYPCRCRFSLCIVRWRWECVCLRMNVCVYPNGREREREAPSQHHTSRQLRRRHSCPSASLLDMFCSPFTNHDRH